MAKKSKTRSHKLTFEQSLEKLEAIVGQLEQGQLGLTESIEQYEQGIKLLRHCHQQLEAVERKVQILTEVNENGTVLVENVEETESLAEIDSGQRARKRGYRSGHETVDASLDVENSIADDEENSADNGEDLDIDDGDRLF